ncbi:MAG: uroporphyrinogen decarboxylase family protein [Candidatus Latescibacteria bacterium]|jgi:uroporphyrinogen decarboxylase|nr:uroporphyrinogen decarboxylase family protein [Candidatus Latescibacterota bacterium]
MIDLGIDVLNPIQWRCQNMDREMLAHDFGHKIAFYGGVDNQQTLAFGSVEDVRAEVRDNIRSLNRQGRYILAPCHNIQALSSPEKQCTKRATRLKPLNQCTEEVELGSFICLFVHSLLVYSQIHR